MREADFWGLLSEGDRQDLISAARFRTFPNGGILCRQGEPTTHVFIVQTGWVKIITDTHEGREVLEALRREGEIVGEMAGHLTGYRTATVQALGTVRALLIGNRQFAAYLDLHPRAGQAYRQAMAAVQQAAWDKLRSHALLSGAQRLAGLLLDLTEDGGQAGDRGQPDRDADAPPPPPPPLSQEELASLISASRSTVTRALQGWRSRQVIGTDPRRVEILDRVRLRQMAGRDSNERLSAHWVLAIRLDASHECGPLSRRKFEYSTRWVTRVSHQHGLSLAGDFHTVVSTNAGFALAPAQGGVPALPTGHPTSLRSADRPASCGSPG